ncbi:TPA: phenylalanine--tRNA ligase subunit alpha [Candidatus Saccharibacteria bacterium]|nr:phenylalanine--tRNA ligase subunit alpha [Candidatus Saccharibacteria bacterium]HIO87637.1 phenylalanine--tRNA ligase subunit alpha [Candidatus Saccharibacteria bacterium]
MEQIENARQNLLAEYEKLDDKTKILRSVEFKKLYSQIPALPPEQRGEFGQAVNGLKQEFEQKLASLQDSTSTKPAIDVTAPFDVNVKLTDQPQVLPASNGSIHPLMSEMDNLLSIFERMGFEAEESRAIDDDYHMFEALNFPEGHPARDDYDTFMTEEGLIAPAHTSTMQNRVLKARKERIESGETIQVVIPGRVFRNEDLDARHEHTFYQLEGVVVGEGINTGHLIATLQTFLETYYEKELEVKTQPFYFPFTEPSFEFAMSCPFCDKAGCKVCGQGWVEILGCGMIHPNVLKMADIDPEKYTGFAWGGGIDRLVMMKHDIEDVRHFHSGKLDFLKQFGN